MIEMECFAELNVFGENGTPSLDLVGDVPWPEPPKKRGMACCSGEVSCTISNDHCKISKNQYIGQILIDQNSNLVSGLGAKTKEIRAVKAGYHAD